VCVCVVSVGVCIIPVCGGGMLPSVL